METRQKVCTWLLQTQCFEKLTLSIPSWLNLKEWTLHTREGMTAKIHYFLWAVTAFVDFRGCMTFVSKVLQFQAIRAYSTPQHLLPEGCWGRTGGNDFLIHQKMQQDGRVAHGNTSVVPEHIALMFHVPFQENYTTHVSYSFSPGYEFPWAQPFAPDVSIAHTRRKSRWNHRHLVLWHLTSPYFCHIEQFMSVLQNKHFIQFFLRKAPSPPSPSAIDENWLEVCLTACGLIPGDDKKQIPGSRR